jgi:hypothetical protein
MPANWYKYQHINNGRIEWPAGPINAQPGFNPTWIQAWAVQGGQMAQGKFWTGPSQSTNQSVWSGLGPGATTWTATETGWIEGRFQQGWALGIALLALENGTGTYEYEWWHGHIILY